jgi:hypothetical protein
VGESAESVCYSARMAYNDVQVFYLRDGNGFADRFRLPCMPWLDH